MALSAEDILMRLVAIPSVNPMGRFGIDPAVCGESRVTEFLLGLFREHCIRVESQFVEDGQHNVLAILEGERPGRLLFEAHQDTVPVDGMTIPPFEPQIRNGRIYGRGACDVKGGMAAMIAAVLRLSELPSAQRPTVVLACTINEEHGFTGASALARCIAAAQRPFDTLPDGIIVAEPTSLQVVAAHKGAVRWRCHTHGIAVHSSRPQLGDNAIYRMTRVVQAIEQFHERLTAQDACDPLCGRAAVSVTTIHGGISVNTVPAQCTIEIDRRLIPGEVPREAYHALVQWIATATDGAVSVEHELPYSESMGLAYDESRPFAARLATMASDHSGVSEIVGAPYGTDASALAPCGAPTVVFGPGSIEQAHTENEWISLEQLETATEIYYRFAREFKG
ncbi:MAG: M20 family metallopeptidase [Planctomycetales bacterium]|nr:M20 family metallopeptidase [Planctomycetales bacterium]